MSDAPRHLDGSPALIETEFVRVAFQHGEAHAEGANGCRVEDVIGLLVDKLIDFQGRAYACEENESALYHLTQARDALVLRRRRREQQGVFGLPAAHRPD
ncbi:MAG: hypothetical protein JST30_00920 [Armatimonadetes bacterium]|nr:hypothetical protein [Armatimonadota bacterium]